MKSLSIQVLADTVSSNRRRLGLSQAELSRLTGLNRATISRIEQLDYTPSIQQLLEGKTMTSSAFCPWHPEEYIWKHTNIQQMKEETGLLVKDITPALHRLQEAFLIYEDQYDGDWDRGWYRFDEIFPNINIEKYTRHEALKLVLQRFAYRLVKFDSAMAKSFYKLPEKEIKLAMSDLVAEGVLVASDNGFMLKTDAEVLESYEPREMHFVYALHRNDFLYKSHEHILKDYAKRLTDGLEYDHEPLQYLLIDGEFHGASVGHFRNGPYDLNDIVCDLPDAEERKADIIQAVMNVNFGKVPERFMGNKI